MGLDLCFVNEYDDLVEGGLGGGLVVVVVWCFGIVFIVCVLIFFQLSKEYLKKHLYNCNLAEKRKGSDTYGIAWVVS